MNRRPQPEQPFDEPWQARAFAMAVVLVETHGRDWEELRARLKAAVAAAPDRPYWESWLTALDGFVLDLDRARSRIVPG